MKPEKILSNNQNTLSEPEKKYRRQRNTKLFLSIAIDIIGNITYFIPTIGETLDIPWAPISGALIYAMYRTNKKVAFTGGLFGFAEEIFPFSDFLPTATSLWFYTYIFNKNKTIKNK